MLKSIDKDQSTLLELMDENRSTRYRMYVAYVLYSDVGRLVSLRLIVLLQANGSNSRWTKSAELIFDTSATVCGLHMSLINN